MDYSNLKFCVKGSVLGAEPDIAYDAIRHYLIFEVRKDDDIDTVHERCEQIAYNWHSKITWM